jgi:pimeloyl-ACP methyl ester carboxylesterase
MKVIFSIILIVLCLKPYCQERYVAIEGQKYRIKTLGTGEITVIFESGASDSLEAWGSLPDTVAQFAHVFLYDRADIGKSDTSRQERIIPNIVNELQNILKVAEIYPPYVFVCHSFGGFICRYFTSQYPDQVKGLLLLDPTPEAYYIQMSKGELNKFIKYGNELNKIHPPRLRKEWNQFVPNLEYMKNLNIPHDLPIILVSASQTNLYQYQEKIISGLSKAIHVELVGAHYIHRDHPDLIIGYIKDLLIK